ncbi:MAG: glycosyltransferase [Chloroflexota bacterium]|nr:glycosyltransferase [Chloroflexota bacterium]
MILNVLTVLYVFCAVLLTLYAAGALILLFAYIRHRAQPVTTPVITEWPRVGIQLPVYNELYVVERLLEAVANLDYPRDKLVVQLLDDSTDETVEIAARKVAFLRAQGLDVHHIRRGSRQGYKAGALAYGLSVMDVEYVAVLDADFIMPPEFLKETVPHLVADDTLAVVQGRWGHLNTFANLLTQGQTLALDGHFVVEQTARNRAGWLMNFNGSGGIWRVKAIEDAGGWKDNTLTEDLDLSYRAQLKGWNFLYLPHVVVPGELPPQIAAYKQQQSRWAKGGSQCFRILIPEIWRNPNLTFMQRYMATMHLGQYMVHPVIILLVLLTPVLVLAGTLQELQLGLLGFAGLGPPLVFIISQHALYTDWRKRLMAFPALLALGTGMAYCNAVAVIGGLLGHQEEFRRTPKFVQAWQHNTYALGINGTMYVELLLSVYAFWGSTVALQQMPAMFPYLTLYALAFGTVGIWGIYDYFMIRRASTDAAAA